LQDKDIKFIVFLSLIFRYFISWVDTRHSWSF